MNQASGVRVRNTHSPIWEYAYGSVNMPPPTIVESKTSDEVSTPDTREISLGSGTINSILMERGRIISILSVFMA